MINRRAPRAERFEESLEEKKIEDLQLKGGREVFMKSCGDQAEDTRSMVDHPWRKFKYR